MLVAWIGITRQGGSNPGFAGTGPRPIAFVEQGKLVHEIARDVFHRGYAPGGVPAVSVRLSIRIELNHDRVLTRSIENCLVDVENSVYPFHDSLQSGDFTFITDYAADRISSVNGGSAVKSVRVTNVKTIDRPKPDTPS